MPHLRKRKDRESAARLDRRVPRQEVPYRGSGVLRVPGLRRAGIRPRGDAAYRGSISVFPIAPPQADGLRAAAGFSFGVALSAVGADRIKVPAFVPSDSPPFSCRLSNQSVTPVRRFTSDQWSDGWSYVAKPRKPALSLPILTPRPWRDPGLQAEPVEGSGGGQRSTAFDPQNRTDEVESCNASVVSWLCFPCSGRRMRRSRRR